ncbi:AraC family transcriptional regulator N-terminal domain-containing protein [Marinobacteraceae bacterium S3BR75-40.1]
MQSDSARQLVDLIRPLVSRDGYSATVLPDVTLMASTRPVPRTPLMYEPSLIVVAQGQKVGYLGDRTIHYNPGQYLVQTLPLPFECQTFASQESPMMGIAVRIDAAMLSELVHETVEDAATLMDEDPLPMASVAMTQSMHEAMVRLVRALHDPVDARVMGRARVREVVYEALKGEQGAALRALVLNQGHYSRIVQVLSRIHADFDREHTVEQLAEHASMSASSFHQYFKQVTRTSPLQYLKRLRLIKARLLLAQDHVNVNQAASAVGYRSVSQFSRDYKRYFSESPAQHRRLEVANAAS